MDVLPFFIYLKDNTVGSRPDSFNKTTSQPSGSGPTAGYQSGTLPLTAGSVPWINTKEMAPLQGAFWVRLALHLFNGGCWEIGLSRLRFVVVVYASGALLWLWANMTAA